MPAHERPPAHTAPDHHLGGALETPSTARTRSDRRSPATSHPHVATRRSRSDPPATTDDPPGHRASTLGSRHPRVPTRSTPHHETGPPAQQYVPATSPTPPADRSLDVSQSSTDATHA